MKLRKLLYKDIPYMLEWMRDEEINKYLAKDFSAFDEESQKKFIDNSITDENITFAIVNDDEDEYLGSISLKNIDFDNKSAEYAICIRKKCMGKNISKIATDLILNYAFYKIGLNRVYLNVLSDNIRANKFYLKYGFIYEGETKESINIRGFLKNLKWYRMLKNEFKEKEVECEKCKKN